MDLWQLHVFVSVVEEESFSRASQAINLSQPTVSTHIKDLEAHFQCRLLDRLGRKTQPTRAGRLLYREAKKLLAMRDRTEATMQDFLGMVRGRLTIGASTIPAGYLLPGIMGEFTKEHPDVTLDVESGDTRQIIEKVMDGRVELGLVGAQTTDPAARQLISQEKWMADGMGLIVRSDHRWARRSHISLNDLDGQPFIGREAGSGTWNSILQSMAEAGFEKERLNIRLTMGNSTAVIQSILSGVGVSILSTVAVAREVAAGDLTALPVQGLDLERHFYLTLPLKRTASPICDAFIRFLKKAKSPSSP